MAENKKYYYLKLKENFFDSDEMVILESMPDGYLYSNILLKLYLRSLKNDGKLMFNDRIPFNSAMLASVTRHSVGVIEKSMQIFRELGLIEILDNGAIYMSDIQNFIGKSSTEADRKRSYRDRIESERLGHLSLNCPDKNPPEIEIEKEIEKEIRDKSKSKSKDINTSYCHYPTDNSNTQSTACADVGKKRTPRKSYSEKFEKFWAAYPKKKAKGDAEKAFNKLKPDDELLETILKALEWQRSSKDWTKDNGQYIPNPATYLNGRRWEDEQGTEVTSPETYSKDKYAGDFSDISL